MSEDVLESVSLVPANVEHPPTAPSLKIAVLLPLSVLLIFIMGILVTTTYLEKGHDVEEEGTKIKFSIQLLYEKGILDHAKILAAETKSILQNESIATAMSHHDRQRLMELSSRAFTDIRGRYGITHWYYHGKDRINLLRVHQPKRFGDSINRHTMLEAERLGAESFGMEIGPLGTYTLRYVHPWYVRDSSGSPTLIGYVELGLEIGQLFNEVDRLLDIKTLIFIEKSLLNRKLWEEGMKAFGMNSDWDRLPNLANASYFQDQIPAPLFDQLFSGRSFIDNTPFDIGFGKAYYRAIPISLKDVRKEHVGYAVALMDTTAESIRTRNNLFVSLFIILIVGLALFTFFYLLLGKTEKRLVEADNLLRQLATHDGLTGLLNHRMFQIQLKDESQRATRYGKQLTMLMIDIDFFKQVNDKHGHHIGDFVLKRISKLIVDQCRNIDTACRYGGEEIAVLLPETPLEEGLHAAERIRLHVESDDFKGSGIDGLKVTVSIGISAFPSHAETPEELSQSADKALYLAKESGRNRAVTVEKSI